MNRGRPKSGPAGLFRSRSIVAALGLAGAWLFLAACGSGGIPGPPAADSGGGSSASLICTQAASKALSGSPVVDSVSPRIGSSKGGVSVTINGRGFAGAKQVIFAREEAQDIHVDSSTRIVAVSPALPSLAQTPHTSVCITVVTSHGRSPRSDGDIFGYAGAAATPTASPSR